MILSSLAGGVLIGVAGLMLVGFNGRILGISGIVGGFLDHIRYKQPLPKAIRSVFSDWRFYFIVGLFTGGAFLCLFDPAFFQFKLERSPLALVVAGVLVGYGARLGNGCTSGHGICGVSRLSPRSLLATLLFIVVGACTVYVVSVFLGGRI